MGRLILRLLGTPEVSHTVQPLTFSRVSCWKPHADPAQGVCNCAT
jgi:hypothetical protein